MAKLSIILLLSLFSCMHKKPSENNELEYNLQQIIFSDSIIDNKIFNPDKYDVFVSFPGGQDSLKKIIYSNLIIPEDFKKSRKIGYVSITLKIDEMGKVVHSAITKSLTPSTEKEALRVVSMLPYFTPAQRNGQNVVSYFSLFIKFDAQTNQ